MLKFSKSLSLLLLIASTFVSSVSALSNAHSFGSGYEIEDSRSSFGQYNSGMSPRQCAFFQHKQREKAAYRACNRYGGNSRFAAIQRQKCLHNQQLPWNNNYDDGRRYFY
ncbi:MAG: hypothetical protein SFU25_11110 [Candidatus Caenarcaniphilales bacterium]|nr:hypothetical protein [Candidatus Caenarcaniphilales bacterium]